MYVIINRKNKDSVYSKRFVLLCSINLSSVILKLMEKLILWYLTYDCNMGYSLSSNQFGFRRDHFTEVAIHILVSKIEKYLTHGNYVLRVFLDMCDLMH